MPSTWLLSGLTANLKHHIAYSCKVRKYGTILYRPNADLLPSIQKAMWRVRHLELARGEPQPESNPNTMHDTQPPDRRVLDDLNDRVHNEVRRLLAANVHTPMKHDQLDVERFIQEADPQLWQAVCLLTRSVSDRKSLKTDGTNSLANRTKRLRRFFLLCVLLFCSDDRCSVPLHTVLTDMIDSQGGSALLVRILNRLGVCASLDTLSRFIQDQVRQSDRKYEHADLHSTGFTVVSADNIDFQHSYARVFCGKQASSWHGTSVQAAQPLPSLGLLEVRRVLARMEVGTTTNPLSYQSSQGISTVNNSESTLHLDPRSPLKAPSDVNVSYRLMMSRKRTERESPFHPLHSQPGHQHRK